MNEGAHCPQVEAHWKHLWKLKIPSKIRHFLWSCLTGYLACTNSLYNTYVVPSPICARCNSGVEDPLHVVWTCHSSKTVLTGASWYPKIGGGVFSDFKDLFGCASSQLRVDEFSHFAFTIWEIWKDRNAFVYGGEAATLPTNTRIDLEWIQWKSAAAGDVEASVAPSRQQHWAPPCPGLLTISADASVAQGKTGLGAIIRDPEGALRVALGDSLERSLPVEAAELMALIMGVEWAHARRWRIARVETNCLTVVQLVNSRLECFAAVGVLVDQLRLLLSDIGVPGLSYFNLPLTGTSCVVGCRASLAHQYYQ